jgi:uncharacterized membrane protein (DUF485 family)
VSSETFRGTVTGRPVDAVADRLVETPVPAPDPALLRRRAEVYQRVRDSAEFQELKRRHRRFAFPMTAVFLTWYLLYVLASTAPGGLLAHQVLGPLNAAMVLALAQFASTFLIAWLYARHASRTRDRAALNLRWDTQEQIR